MIWFFENPRRTRHERESLEALSSSVDWLTPIRWRTDDSLRLMWDADISTPARTFPITLRYPNHFPHSPPSVLPRGDSVRWSSHQYGPGGELCLEYGPDNWHPDITGSDMILSAHRLLHSESSVLDEDGIVASRHRTTIGQDLRGIFTRFMTTPALESILGTLPESATCLATVLITFRKESFVYLVLSIVMPNGEAWTDQGIPGHLQFESFEQPMILIRWPANTPLPSTDTMSSFRASAANLNLEIPSVKYALLVQDSIICVYALSESDNSVSEISVIPPQPVVGRLDESHSILANRKVGIVGCGSLGSKLAAMMARSGVGRFLLVDDDILFPDNFVRHDLDWRDVGAHKVDAVARRIQLVNPAASCERRKHKLGGQESSGGVESLIEALSKCDLIVDATADPSVFNYLCAAVASANKPLLWAEVFGGGFGGLIARHRPSIEPDPASMRRAIENWCSERGKPIERSALGYGASIHVSLIADDADVTVIASHAARLGIDTLIPRNPSMFPSSVYMIGLAEGWIFSQPFETYPVDVGPPNIPEGRSANDPVEAAEELKRILQLFTEQKDAASSSSPGN